MAKSVLKLTNTTAVVKCAVAGTYTIDLSVDLKLPREVLDGVTQTININEICWCGNGGGTGGGGGTDSSVTITRNSVVVADINSDYSGVLDFTKMGFTDSTENTSDIEVVITGKAQVWIVLRKISGYKTTFEPEQYGPYDDPDNLG